MFSDRMRNVIMGAAGTAALLDSLEAAGVLDKIDDVYCAEPDPDEYRPDPLLWARVSSHNAYHAWLGSPGWCAVADAPGARGRARIGVGCHQPYSEYCWDNGRYQIRPLPAYLIPEVPAG